MATNLITINQTSEFMTNLLPANPVPAGNTFITFQDQNENPAVFALGEDSKLSLIITDDECPSQVDFGQLCNFQGTIQAFGVQQNDDNSLFIAVASDAGNSKSNMYILNNVAPADLLTLTPTSIINAGNSFPAVYDIFVSNFTEPVGTTTFPKLFLSLCPPGSITQSSQLGYLDVTSSGPGTYSFTLNTSWRLMTDPISILDVTFGTCPLGTGAFVLYEASDGNHIQFTTFDGRGFVCEPNCPSGATCLTSYIDPTTTYTDLLVGGDVITQYTYRQYCIAGGQGVAIATGDASLGLKDIHINQANGNMTIWYTTQALGVHYYTAPLTSLNSGVLTQLLEDGQGGQISSIIMKEEAGGELVINTLLSVDQTGHITMLQCPSDSDMWQSVPFYAPSASNNMEIPSFTIRFQAVSQDPNNPAANCQLLITNEGSVQAFANGVKQTIDQEGRWYQADNSGVVNLIVTTDDMSTPQYHVTQFQADGGSPIQLTNNPVYNPAFKLNQGLAQVTDGNSLLNMKTQTGELLIAPGSVPQDLANEAAGAITTLNKQQLLLGQSSDRLYKRPRGPRFYNPRNLKPTFLAGHLSSDPEKRARLMAKLSVGAWYNPWDAFKWLCEKVADVVQWGVTQLEKGYNFFIELGTEVFNFLIDSIETFGKAISWVFDKISVAVGKLIEWIGFLFNWGDILATADSIAAFVNSGLGYGIDQIDGVKAGIPAFIRSIGAAMGSKQQPPEVASGSEYQDPDNNATLENTRNTVGYNYASYQASYGGMGANGSVDMSAVLRAGVTDTGATIEDLWQDMSNVVQDFEQIFVAMANGVSELFTPTTTSDQVFQKIGQQLIDSAMQCAQDLAITFVDGLSLLVSTIQSMLNATIELPIFSALWSLISKGRPFTVLNAFSLIMAIPATVVYKAVTNSAPPDLSSMTKDIFASYVNGTLGDDEALGITRSQILLFGGMAIFTALELQIAFDAISIITNKIKGLAAETMDTGMIFLGIGLLIAGWPTAGSVDMSYRWMVWGIDCSNVFALSLGRFAGWKLNVPREETAPLIAVWAALDNIPSYMLKILINIDADKGDAGLLARHIVEDTLTLLKTWCTAIKECVPAEPYNKIATFAGYGCTGIVIVMKIVDFYLQADPSLEWIGTTPYTRSIAGGAIRKQIEGKQPQGGTQGKASLRDQDAHQYKKKTEQTKIRNDLSVKAVGGAPKVDTFKHQ